MHSVLRIAFCCLVILHSGCATNPSVSESITEASPRIYFIYREWHTSILIPASAVALHSRYMKEEALGQQFVRVGWGDGDYFTGKSKTLGAATKALFISRYSALQILGYSQDPFADLPASTWVPLAITDEGMRNLIRYIDESFDTADEQPIPLPAYGEGIGHFYQSSGDYGLLSNCNTWSGRALQAAGLPVRSRLHLTAQSVFEQARAISNHQFTTAPARPGNDAGL